MAYIEVRKDGKLVKCRLVDDTRAEKGCKIRVGSAGQVHLRKGELKRVGQYEIEMLEGVPPEVGHEAARQLGTKSDSLPPMSGTKQAEFIDMDQTRSMDMKSSFPTIDDYEVIGRLGQGGMGTVWRAVQLSTKREVALKFLGKHRFASKRSRARFEREVSLAAKLTHPNIACVYDSGLHRGVYYYAMELVDGIHLDKYVQQNQLTQREILALMKDVCDAVGYAHDKGIIHRDLKPSNILVTKDGRPHVVDFGLAKTSIYENDDITISIDGEITGTLAYMSPEQAAGRLDKIGEPTDVYSLGVILHQLLTGHFPHDLSGSRYDVVKRIVEEDIQSPRIYDDSVDSDLESLILTALAQEPEDRYPSAVVLSQDIENYLDKEPLLARSMSATYRIRKHMRKYVKPLAKALLLIIALASMMTVSFYLVSSERKKRLEAERRAGPRQERTEPLYPQESHPSEGNQSNGSVNNENNEQDIEQRFPSWAPKRDPAPAAIKIKGDPFFLICANRPDTNELSEYKKGGFNAVLLSDSNSTGFSEARKLGLHIISQLTFDKANPPDLNQIKHRLAQDAKQSGLLCWTSASLWPVHSWYYENFEHIVREAIAVSSNTPIFLSIYPRSTRNLSGMMKRFGYSNGFVLDPHIFERGETKTGYPTEVSTVAFWMDQMNGVMKSKPIWTIAKRYGPKKVDMSMIEDRNNKFRSLVYLAVNHGATGIIIPAYDEELHFMYKDKTLKSQLAQALQTLSKAVLAGAVLDEVTIKNDNGKIDFKTYMSQEYGRLYVVAVNTSETEIRPTIHIPEFSQGSIYRMNEDGGGINENEYKNWQFVDTFKPYQTHVYTIRTRKDLGSGSHDRAQNHVEQRANVSEISGPPDNFKLENELGDLITNIGHTESGRDVNAPASEDVAPTFPNDFNGQSMIDQIRKTLEFKQRTLGQRNPETLDTMNQLGIALNRVGKAVEAERIFQTALEIQQQVSGPEHPCTLDLMHNMAVALFVQGKYAKAEKLDRETLEIRRNVLGNNHPYTMRSIKHLAHDPMEQEKFSKAEVFFREAIGLWQKNLDPEHPETLELMNKLGIIMRRQSKAVEAEKIFRKTAEMRRRILGKEHPDTLNSIHNIAVALRDQDRYSEAEILDREVLAARLRVLRKDHPYTLRSINGLSEDLIQQGKYTEVEKLLRQSIDFYHQNLGEEHPCTEILTKKLDILLKEQSEASK